jgi:FixJ family two-component response regulator
MADVSGAVFVIDDDPSMRAALGDLVSFVGLQVRLFASPGEFLQSNPPGVQIAVELRTSYLPASAAQSSRPVATD